MTDSVSATRQRQLVIWRVKRGLRDLGLSGIAGVVMLLFCAGYYVFTYAPLQNEVAARTQALMESNAEPAQRARAENAGTPRMQLDEFYSRLTKQDDVSEVVRALYRSASAAGLRFVRGDYRPQRDGSGKLLRYQITLPVRGEYPKVRRFLDQALRDEPALSLDAVGFQTDKSGGNLETRVQFTLFVSLNEPHPASGQSRLEGAMNAESPG